MERLGARVGYLFLESAGPRPNETALALRSCFPGLHANQAAGIAASAPTTVHVRVTSERTEEVLAKLARAGATARMWTREDQAREEREYIASLRAKPTFFPHGALGRDERSDAVHAEWFTAHLAALGETALAESARVEGAREAYRFLLLPTFTAPRMVRLWSVDSATSMALAIFGGGLGGYEARPFVRREECAVSGEDFAAGAAAFDAVGVWTGDLERYGPAGLDGEQWVFEAWREGAGYGVVHAWSPPDNAARRTGQWAMEFVERALGAAFWTVT